MKLVRLIDAAESKTPLGTFLGALMREFEPHEITLLIGRLERNVGLWMKNGWDAERNRETKKHLAGLFVQCKKFGLAQSARHIRAILQEHLDGDESYIARKYDDMIGALRRNVCWEMESFEYFEVSDKADLDLWREDYPFGKRVHRAFRKSRYDIEQSAKCLVVDRYTASVFHGLRVLESGLNALAISLGIANPVETDRSWGKVLRKIKEQIELRENSKEPAWKKRIPHLWDAHTYLQSVKRAWRDDTMHVGEKYDGPEAKRIHGALKSFMEHIAELINHKGVFYR